MSESAGVRLQFAIPLLHVTDANAAQAFYCSRLGFAMEFAYRAPGTEGPCYCEVIRDGVRMHLSTFPGDGLTGGVVNMVVTSVDHLHLEFIERGVAIDLPPTDQTWGTREMYVKDGDGNTLRFQQRPASFAGTIRQTEEPAP